MKLSDRKEDYLKAINQIISEKGYAQVRDIAKMLNVGPSTVSLMLQKLTKNEYINYQKYSCVTLTTKGKEIANKTQKKYSTIIDFLVTLGIDYNIASEDACKMEHIIAPQTYLILTQFCEFSMTQKGSKNLKLFKKYCYTGMIDNCNSCYTNKKIYNLK